jgi:hypothetical protein
MVERLENPPWLAERLGVPLKTLAVWRSQGKGPRYVRVGKHVRYDPRDVEAWIRAQTRDPETA